MEKELYEYQYSPVQIVGLARREGRQIVSVTSIYHYIHKNKVPVGSLYKYLRHQLKHRKRPEGRYCSIKDRVSIDERLEIVDTRTRFENWEIDTIVGKEGKGAIVTLTERKTGFLLMEKLQKGKLLLSFK